MWFAILGLIIGLLITSLEFTVFKDHLPTLYFPIGIILNNAVTGGIIITIFSLKKKHDSDWMKFLGMMAVSITLTSAIFVGLTIPPP